MIQRTDRLQLQVHVSFETTRFGPQHLMEAYACLVPTVRRTSLQPKRSDAQLPKAATASGGDGWT